MDTANNNSIQVAIVDNNVQLRDNSVKQLENSGFTVFFQAGSGQDALQKLKGNNNLPDVCIIEENLEAAKVLLEIYPDLKVLISSMNDNEENVTDMLKTGVSGYILKFADPDEMITAVKALSENRKYFSVGISGIAMEYFVQQS
ncbi:MAG: response regulator transcription factor [Chitinophagaceae bacterium]|nr:response regulator transcription factor [Chitinophagaceae bacterium]